EIEATRGDSAVRDIQSLPDDGHLYAAHVINDLWRATREGDTIVVTDVGQHQMWEAQYYHHERPRSLITSGGLGTMGFAVPAAIGIRSRAVTSRGDVVPAIEDARAHQGPVVIDFRVEQEDTVYPMVPAGADLHAMIRRPNPIVETAAD